MAGAQTLLAPVGGKAIALGNDVEACGGSEVGTWRIDDRARQVRPPTREDGIGHEQRLMVASPGQACAAATKTIGLVAVGRWPQVDSAGLTIEVDGGRLLVRGHGLKDSVLRWRTPTAAGTDTCDAPQADAATEQCAFTVPREVSSDPGALDIFVLPAGSPPARPDERWFDSAGQPLAWPAPLHPTRVIVTELLPPETLVDLHAGSAELPLRHPEAIASIDCADAVCEFDGQKLIVRGEHGTDGTLDLRVRLRPHIAVSRGTALESAPAFHLPLQRCPVELASAPPFQGVTDQRIVLRVGGPCAATVGLHVADSGRPLPVERRLATATSTLLVAALDRLEGDEVHLTVERDGSVLGALRVPARASPQPTVKLTLAGGTVVDFIPTNRAAELRVSGNDDTTALEPMSQAGAYRISPAGNGRYRISGVPEAVGTVAIRLAVHDPRLPSELASLTLAVLSDPVMRALRPASVPVPLAGNTTRPPLLELLCGDGDAHVQHLTPGTTQSVPFRARGTCRLIIHRERLTIEDGPQDLRIRTDVLSADGDARSGARRDKHLRLHPADQPTTMYISGIQAPFDRLLVEASHGDVDEDLGAAEVQWTVIFGTERARLYATATIPTGLFRVADQHHSGILTLNAGGLFRLVHLDREGTESFIGLEGGVMWLGIPGDTDASGVSRGQVVSVGGLGLSVPIANRSRASQTSINLHVWAEYEVSRKILHQPGSAVGLVFGPSISIGDVGANL